MTIDTDAKLVAEIRRAFDKEDGNLAPGLKHRVMGYGLDGKKAWEVRQLCIAAADALEHRSTTGNWISVKEQPPDHAEPVIYARSKGNGKWSVGIAYWTVSQKWFPEHYGLLAPRGFTYYMNLGVPPEGDKR